MRLARRALRFLLELASAAWAGWVVGMVLYDALELVYRVVVGQSPAPGPVPGTTGPTYPNEWGVRLEPLTPAELEQAIALELELADGTGDTGPDPATIAAPAAGVHASRRSAGT